MSGDTDADTDTDTELPSELRRVIEATEARDESGGVDGIGDGGGTEEPTFEAPWQARAFALVVALSGREAFTLDRFQEYLIEEIESGADQSSAGPSSADASVPDASAEVTTDHEIDIDADAEATYYSQWIGACERLLVDEGVVSPGQLRQRITEFEAGERDASEFVIGDRGHHDHEH